ncbi:metallophosphoesterase [Ancylomarina euxinus]|uniref:Phosphoesterase n=1 Tax=Ancylomarina euxinus TaxID=2283627 RepID=A0A425Y488_9BACT|nr:metallophosphoesterase family protein [Ancylomarina euxinus]MCZ4694656.1 metallophosphoesterase family protein [Ancylomarina euxinus]MUP14201.1 YfcE family phosphodiesterase [Ancylomarina euxinus]RRG23105.1 metallophosphoesterase [Ancylomarina euxinus]
MKRIALLSDTHTYLDENLFKHLEGCDEIWHAGDIGNIETADRLAECAPLKAVYGNADGQDVRQVHPLHQRFKCEDLDVWMTHIGGYPKRYDINVREEIKRNPPELFISGHSHILKVMFDKELNLLHINPGAAGMQGFHQVQTLIRFTIDGKQIKDLEVVEFGTKGK